MAIEEKGILLLRTYSGTNDYLIWLKKQLDNKSFLITRLQAKYVIDNHNVTPTLVNKFVPIHKFSGNYMQKRHSLSFEPTHVLIYKILSRKGGELHIWGAFEENPKYHMSIYLNKKDFVNIKTVPEIEFTKYTRLPMPHQIPAVKSLLANEKFILADTMGLGKTTSAIIAAVEGGFKKILVVCPASLKLNWKIEIGYYDDKNDISVVDGSKFCSSKWTIINYDVLKNHHTPIKDKEGLPVSPIDFSKFDLVIADECHYLKNSTSNRTKIFEDFASRIKTRWFLTGTPITNKPIDFYSLLDLCDSPMTQNWAAFVKRYCNGFKITNKATGKSFWKLSGASNLEELNRFTSDLILRRTKSELNLPLKTTKPIFLPLTMSTKYNQYIDEYEQWVSDMKEQEIDLPMTAHLTKLTAVRQLLSQDKVNSTISLIEDYIEEGHKVVVFSCFTETIRTIHEHFNKTSVLVDGSVSTVKRQAAVEKFQNNEKITLFCGNIIAAGVGLTLTKGTILIFNDLDWVPANHAQASDRIHRIGQENDVHIIYQLVLDTIDIIMFNSLQEKMKVIGEILGDDVIEDISVSKAVIKQLKKGK